MSEFIQEEFNIAINPEFDSEKYKFRQARFMIGNEMFLVINATQYNAIWKASIIVIKGELSTSEIEIYKQLLDCCLKVQTEIVITPSASDFTKFLREVILSVQIL
jgi:hypothetical protein